MHAHANSLVVVLAAQRIRVHGQRGLLHGAHVIDVFAPRRREVGIVELHHTAGFALGALEAPPRIVDQRSHRLARTHLWTYADDVDVRDDAAALGWIEALTATEQIEPLGAECGARARGTPGRLLLLADRPHAEARCVAERDLRAHGHGAGRPVQQVEPEQDARPARAVHLAPLPGVPDGV